jgi:hypothetical protein
MVTDRKKMGEREETIAASVIWMDSKRSKERALVIGTRGKEPRGYGMRDR